jgi:hypothetical protein
MAHVFEFIVNLLSCEMLRTLDNLEPVGSNKGAIGISVRVRVVEEFRD